jgi:hypothetical protein
MLKKPPNIVIKIHIIDLVGLDLISGINGGSN